MLEAGLKEPELASPDATLRLAKVVYLAVLAPLHLLLLSATVGIRLEHLILDGVFAGLFLAGDRAAKFALYALPFWLVGLAYEAMPLLLPLRGQIHTGDLYAAEVALFGVNGRTIPQILGDHLHPALDALAGSAYILYLAEVFGLAIWFYFKDPRRMAAIGAGFLILNLAGIAGYLLYPAAPPWYVDLYGAGPAVLEAAPSAARAERFDQLIGIGVFASFYSRNVNVFGAMPSLHCAYPTLLFLICRPLGKGWAMGTALFALCVWFGAIYLNHHYVLDVIAGITLAIAVYFTVSRRLIRWSH